MAEKIAAVVVTYNRKEKLEKNLRCLLSQSMELAKIYVIDNNSHDGTHEMIAELQKNSDKIIYKRLESNTGGAGGFSFGLHIAYEEDNDYIWGMDDDAFPKEDALEKIMNCKGKISEEACFWSNCNKDQDFSASYKKVKSWMFVGFFISKKVICKVGFPREDFFIFYDDLEYADRIIKNGFSIYKVRDSIIVHQDAVSVKKALFKISNFQFSAFDIPQQKWKVYYWIRNSILMYSYNDIRKYYAIFMKCGVRFLKILLFSPKKLGVFFEAFYHGIIGKSGKIKSTDCENKKG